MEQHNGDFPGEEWVECRDFSNYSISNYGRVGSSLSNKILAPIKNDHGYLYVSFRDHGKNINLKIHRLVAMEFCPGWFKGAIVNHIDGVKTNNHATNLEWETYSGNARHAFSHGLRVMTNKKKVFVPEIDKTYESITDCSRDLNISERAISRCLSTRGGKVFGYHFESVTHG